MSDKIAENTKLFWGSQDQNKQGGTWVRPKQIDNVIISYIQCW